MADTLISFTVIDADGDKKNVHVLCPAASTPTQISTFIGFFAPLLDAVIDGAITDISYKVNVTKPGGLKASAVANSEAQRGALFSFDNASRYNWGLFVPTWKDANFTGDEVNVGDAGDVDAFVAAYVTGDGTIAPTNGQAFDLTALSKSKKTFRK